MTTKVEQNYLIPSPRASLCLSVSVIVILGLRMLVSVLLHPLRIGWDPALHLMCADLIRQGKLPYVDMFDVNPPLIWYINTLPASLAALFHVPLPLSFNLFLLAIMMLSASMSAYVVLKKLPRTSLFVYTGVIIGLLAFNFFLTVDFGQREEIFVLLYMPFFFLRLARWQGAAITRTEAILFGLVGAAGICMKHYFVLNFMAVELFFLLSSKRKTLKGWLSPLLTAENIVVAIFGLAYVGHFFLLPAAVRHNYFDLLLPAFARGYYFWDTTIANNMTLPFKRDVFLFFCAVASIATVLVRRYPVFGALFAFGISGVVVYLLQFKGWAYQDIPVLAAAYMLAGGCLGALFYGSAVLLPAVAKNNKLNIDLIAYLTAFILAGYCFVSANEETSFIHIVPQFDLAILGYSGSAPRADIETPFTDIILRDSKAGDPIVFISNAVAPGFPITMQLHRSAGSRHLHVCLLSVLQYVRSSGPKDAETERLLSYEPWAVNSLGEDILKNHPPLVFLQEMPVNHDYFLPYNFVRKYLSHYKLLEEVCGFSVYRLQSDAAAVTGGAHGH